MASSFLPQRPKTSVAGEPASKEEAPHRPRHRHEAWLRYERRMVLIAFAVALPSMIVSVILVLLQNWTV